MDKNALCGIIVKLRKDNDELRAKLMELDPKGEWCLCKCHSGEELIPGCCRCTADEHEIRAWIEKMKEEAEKEKEGD